MTDNLRLVGPFQPDEFDSDVSWSRGAGTFTLPASANVIAYNDPHVLDTGNADYGTYYNWNAATAGTGTQSISSGDASASICSKGWHLPTISEFQALYSYYSSLALMRDTTSGPGFVYAGHSYGGTIYGQGAHGFYWSSTATGPYGGGNLYLDNSGVSTRSDFKYFGMSVRCLAK